MSFKINSLYLTDGYKVGHKAMLAPGTTKLYGTWIPRSTKHAPKGITKIVSFGQQLVWKWLHDEFEENFFFRNQIFDNIGKDTVDNNKLIKEYGYFTENDLKSYYKKKALQFVKDMSLYLGMEYNGKHFEELWDLGYLPIRVKALPEGIETNPNIPHMTFVNTVDGFAWLTLYLETVVSALAWKPSTAATIAKLYRRQAEEWVAKTDNKNMWLVDFMCHDFSARGLDPMSQYLIGLGHATSFKGSDTLPVIPAARYFYGVKEDEMPIFSVNASEHSVSCTKIFTVGEKQMLSDWMKIFPKGILSVVADTFSLWECIEYFKELKDEIVARDGKIVCRPDSGDPVDIICGLNSGNTGLNINTTFEEVSQSHPNYVRDYVKSESEWKGVIELLWDIFGGTINEQGYKVLDPHIGAIYGDSITPDRQRQIYERLAAKGFAATNIVLGVGSFTYQYNTRDTLGWAAKGAWFEVGTQKMSGISKTAYNIYKDPITDDGTKKSLKGLLCVIKTGPDSHVNQYMVKEECTPEWENKGLLQVIYEDGKFYNTTTLEEVRNRLKQ